MKSKISWYQEVLEIEPHSKVFFPLAKLFLENDQPEEALNTLRQGLVLHPEFVEAKLLLADVLQRLDQEDELDGLVQNIAQSMAEYPAFWDAWARQLEGDAQGRDPAVAMRFLAAYFSGTSLSWTNVIQAGLEALLEEDKPPHEAKQGVVGSISGMKHTMEAMNGVQEPVAPAAVQLSDNAAAELSVAQRPDRPAVAQVARTMAAPRVDAPAYEEETVTAVQEEPESKSGETFEETAPVAGEGFAEGDDEYDEENEETFSLRTRTMADLLAEQGDSEGALDIYRELAATTQDAVEREELEALVAQLQNVSDDKSGGNTGRSAKTAHKKDAEVAKGKKKLMHVLESLAQRLEVKAANS